MALTYIPGKYTSARDEMLDRIYLHGWANESSGDMDSNAGFFCIIKNPPAEVAEIANAFSDDLTDLGLTADDLAGYFVLHTDSQGFVTVHDFETEMAAEIVYAEFEREYQNWCIDTM